MKQMELESRNKSGTSQPKYIKSAIKKAYQPGSGFHKFVCSVLLLDYFFFFSFQKFLKAIFSDYFFF